MTNEEAREAWKKLYSEIDKDNWLFVGTINPEMVALAIKALEERPQGEWIVIHNALGKTKYQCNQCQHFIKPGDDKNFCPNCGAKMRKEEDCTSIVCGDCVLGNCDSCEDLRGDTE